MMQCSLLCTCLAANPVEFIVSEKNGRRQYLMYSKAQASSEEICISATLTINSTSTSRSKSNRESDQCLHDIKARKLGQCRFRHLISISH